MGTPASFFSTILLVTAGITGGVGLLDFILSDKQKALLSNAAVRIWSFVDDAIGALNNARMKPAIEAEARSALFGIIHFAAAA